MVFVYLPHRFVYEDIIVYICSILIIFYTQMNRHPLAIIGTGTIAEKHIDGLRDSEFLACRYICDVDPVKLEQDIYKDYDKFESLDALLSAGVPIDYAMVATPISSHFEVVQRLLRSGIRPICEKPLVDNIPQMEQLFQLAQEVEQPFDVLFHWRYGVEMIWFMENVKPIIDVIESIEMVIFDPYACEGNIAPQYRAKQGTWFDSGVNALSVVAQMVDIGNVVCVSKQMEIDPTCNMPLYSHHRFDYNASTTIDITVDWRGDNRDKWSKIICKSGLYIINHTEQKVLHDGEVIFEDATMDRLTRHYYNYYINYPQTRVGREDIINIHQVLFDNI